MGSIIGKVVGGISQPVARETGAIDQFTGSTPYSQEYFNNLIANQNQIYGGQNTLAQALQQQMAGQGPNPAQLQYQGNVQNNIANAQGLIASQRGLNPALATKIGSNIGAKANQEAALASALLQQQQQLAATQNLGNLYGQMQQGNLAAQGGYNQMFQNAQAIRSGAAARNAQAYGQMAGQVAGGLSGAGQQALTALGSSGATQAAMGSHGGKVTGKAKVKGDSPENDTVHALLSPGEIVIPRTAAEDPDKAKAFIDHLLKSEDKKTIGYGDVLEKKRKKKELEAKGKA